MRLPPRPLPNAYPIFKPGPVRTVGAALIRFVRRHPGLTLYFGLIAPWLLGSQEPAWAGVAGGLLVLTIPMLLLGGAARFVGDYRRFIRRNT